MPLGIMTEEKKLTTVKIFHESGYISGPLATNTDLVHTFL